MQNENWKLARANRLIAANLRLSSCGHPVLESGVGLLARGSIERSFSWKLQSARSIVALVLISIAGGARVRGPLAWSLATTSGRSSAAISDSLPDSNHKHRAPILGA